MCVADVRQLLLPWVAARSMAAAMMVKLRIVESSKRDQIYEFLPLIENGFHDNIGIGLRA